jgi:hypothetical protein
MKARKLNNTEGQPSWRVATPRIEAFVTQMGGQLGPVVFDRQGKRITPFSIAPWAREKLDPDTPPIIRALRGDFFCLPFGGNGTPFRNERHPIHGETANAMWTFASLGESDGRTTLQLRLKTRIRRGSVEKLIVLPHDHDAIYQRHIIRDMTGPMDFGHHAMLRFPDEEGSGVISTSRFVYGQVFDEPFERPEQRGYQMLESGARFTSLARVPTITRKPADLTLYPARRGFEDLVMIVADEKLPFAWTAVTFAKERYAWFALKNPRVLSSTIFWISNGGRHYAPWSGRHVNVMGIEDVTANFHKGLAESAQANALSRQGIRTHVKLNPRRPLVVNYIMGVVSLPADFGMRVESIEATRGGIVLRGRKRTVRTPVDLAFLQNENPRAV